jgi:AraC-like DNA-binding protein
LQYAYEQLDQPDMPLRVICEMAGHPDSSNFSLAFWKQFGYRPGAVRTSPRPSAEGEGGRKKLKS